MSDHRIQAVQPNAYLNQATQIFDQDIQLLAARGYLLPQPLQARVLWSLPVGQLLDSRGHLPTIGDKSPGDATYFVFGPRPEIQSEDNLRLVPGRYGVVSSVKLEDVPDADTLFRVFAPDGPGIHPDWSPLGTVSGDVQAGVQQLQVTGSGGIEHETPASSTYAGRRWSVSAAIDAGPPDPPGAPAQLAVDVVLRGYNYLISPQPIYEETVSCQLINNRWHAFVDTPSLTDFGNLPGYTTEVIEHVSFGFRLQAFQDRQLAVFGVQIEPAVPTSLAVTPMPRGLDRLQYPLPHITPGDATLALWVRWPLQSTGKTLGLLGQAGGTFYLSRKAGTPATDTALELELQSDGGSYPFRLQPSVSVLDEQSHLFVLALGMGSVTGLRVPVAYVSLDGEELGTDVDDEGRPCFAGGPGEHWSLGGLLRFSDGSVHAEIENPTLFAGVLSHRDGDLLLQASAPVQALTAPPALATAGVSEWQVFAVTPGMSQIDLGTLGLHLVDVLVDDIPQYAGVHFVYDPLTGILEFDHPALADPGPIEGDLARIRFASQAFLGSDADTLNGRPGISADDPRIGTQAAANRYIALDQDGKLPMILGLPATDFVRATEKGRTVGTLVPDPVTGQLWPPLAQRPKASYAVLGMVQIGQFLKVLDDGKLTLEQAPVWASQLGVPTVTDPVTTVVTPGVATLDSWGSLSLDQRPKAGLTTLGMVKVATTPDSTTGIWANNDLLELTIGTAVDQSRLGPEALVSLQPFFDRRVGTLKQYNTLDALGNPLNTWLQSPEERPVAQRPGTTPSIDELGMVKIGKSLSIDAAGVLDIARLGEVGIAPSLANPAGLPGIATLMPDGKLDPYQRPVMSPTEVGMARIGAGLTVNSTVLNPDLGQGLTLDGNQITVKLGTGLSFVGTALTADNGDGTGYIPASAIPGYSPATAWSDVHVALLDLQNGKLVLKEDQRPIAGNSLGMVKVDGTSHLTVDADGVVQAVAATSPDVGQIAGTPGIVTLGTVEQTGLYVDDDNLLKVRPPVPDYTDYNTRQERNLAASLVGRWVMYVPAGTTTVNTDQGAYVDAIRKQMDPYNKPYWLLNLAGGTDIEYRNLTAIPPDNGRGYVAGASTPTSTSLQADATTTVDRITSLEACGLITPVSLQPGKFFSESTGFGLGDHAYFAGGRTAAATVVGSLTKITDKEVPVYVVAGITARRLAASATCLNKAFIAGGYTDPTNLSTAPVDSIYQVSIDSGVEASRALGHTLKPFSTTTTGTSAGTAGMIGDSGGRGGHLGIGFSQGAFFMGGWYSGAKTLVTNDWTTKVLPDGSASKLITLNLDLKYMDRALAGACRLDRYGYIAGGRINTASNTASSRVIERFDPTDYTNRLTSALLMGGSAPTVSEDSRVATAAVSTGSKAFFIYDESLSTNMTAANVIDRMDKTEAVIRVAASLTQKRLNAAGASVLI